MARGHNSARMVKFYIKADGPMERETGEVQVITPKIKKPPLIG